MADVSELILDIFDILKETEAKVPVVKQAMFDILVSFENHGILEDAERDIENCRTEDAILDSVIDEYFESLDNPSDFEEDEEEY